MTFAAKEGTFFWSNGYAWGSCSLKRTNKDMKIELSVLEGELALSKFTVRDFGAKAFDETVRIKAGQKTEFYIRGKTPANNE